MAEAIKSWYSPKLGWTWHATEDRGGGIWYGYVEGNFNEWGNWSDDQLEEAGAVETTPGTVPD